MPRVQQPGGELEAHAAGTDPADARAVLGGIRHFCTSVLEDGSTYAALQLTDWTAAYG
ncbi:hypothetical protein ACIOJE_18180 [Kitasatospora sp. NPDC087861]|uniref:hypothetical protein n=1 Tax=Kitasatospora sp. NPDC087861 TaxID=3364070 RepID=UPI0037FED7DA